MRQVGVKRGAFFCDVLSWRTVRRAVLSLEAMCRYGHYLNYGALRPRINVVGLRGPSLRRSTIGFRFCTILLVRSYPDNYYYYKQGCCSCSGTAVIFLAPNRVFHVDGRGALPSGKCLLTFRPSLLFHASLGGRVGGCAFFRCHGRRTLRLSQHRARGIAYYLSGVRSRLRRPVSARDDVVLSQRVRLLLSCYAQCCRHRFVAHRGGGGTLLRGVRHLFIRCVTSKELRNNGLPASNCVTKRLSLSITCFGSLLEFRANGALRRCFRLGQLSVTERVLLRSNRAPTTITQGLNCPGIRYFDILFGGVANITPDSCQLSRG